MKQPKPEREKRKAEECGNSMNKGERIQRMQPLKQIQLKQILKQTKQTLRKVMLMSQEQETQLYFTDPGHAQKEIKEVTTPRKSANL
jgi:septum formation inhibitor MinC